MKKVLIVSSSEENITQLKAIFGGEQAEFYSIRTMRLALPLYAQRVQFDLAFLDDEFGDLQQLMGEITTFQSLWEKSKIVVLPMPTVRGPYLDLLRQRADFVVPKKAILDLLGTEFQQVLTVLASDFPGE